MIFEIDRASDALKDRKPYKDTILGWIDECEQKHYIMEIPDLDALLRFRDNVKTSLIVSKRFKPRGGEPPYCITIYDDFVE